MSTFWATVRGKKDAESPKSDDIGKPPSGRSSVTKGSRTTSPKAHKKDKKDSVDEQKDTDEDKPSRGCLRMSRLRDQVLPKNIKMPHPFSKGHKTGSLPRHGGKKKDVPPTPVPTPESEQEDDNPMKPPIPDSPKPEVKGFRKRAASASPSRHEGEKRKFFRGISRERLLAPLPAPIRKFLFTRQSQSVPREVLPSKPLRRPGPLGRSWVKVYDDIAFMDDQTSLDLFPIPGYTGQPTKVPDAEPLPRAPTPPPKKSETKTVLAPEKETSDEARPLSEQVAVLEDSSGSHEDDARIEGGDPMPVETDGQAETRDDTKELSLQESLNSKNPALSERRSRSRENTRFKSKKTKRPATPVGRDVVLPSPEEILANADIKDADKDEDTVSEESMEDGYIIPKSLLPEKPIRKSNTHGYVKISSEKLNSIINQGKEQTDVSTDLKKDSIKERASKKLKALVGKRSTSCPEETFTVQKTKVVTIFNVRNKTQGPEKSISSSQNAIEELLFVPQPRKPLRNPKFYENMVLDDISVPNHEKLDEHELLSEMPGDIVPEPIEIEAPEQLLEAANMLDENVDPPRPTRGHKTYSKVIFNSPPVDMVENQMILKEIIGTEEVIDSPISEEQSAKDALGEESPFKSPEYAMVVKDRLSKELREVASENPDLENIPPPVPPKKKNIQMVLNSPVLDSCDDLFPPKPARHLKPRPRSLDPSPSSNKRQRVLTLLNESCPPKPVRGTKIYAGVNLKGSTPKTQTPISVRRRINHRERPLPAPPRKKKQLNKEQVFQSPEVTESLPGGELENNKTIGERYSSKEQMGASSSEKRKKRGRHLPPLPPKHVTHNEPQVKPKVRSEFVNDIQLPTTSSECPSFNINPDLDNAIESNLKNIESSFATLDSVLSSLQKYSRESQTRNLPLETRRRRSCDVICDFLPNVQNRYVHSMSNDNTLSQDIARIEISSPTSRILTLPNETSSSPEAELEIDCTKPAQTPPSMIENSIPSPGKDDLHTRTTESPQSHMTSQVPVKTTSIEQEVAGANIPDTFEPIDDTSIVERAQPSKYIDGLVVGDNTFEIASAGLDLEEPVVRSAALLKSSSHYIQGDILSAQCRSSADSAKKPSCEEIDLLLNSLSETLLPAEDLILAQTPQTTTTETPQTSSNSNPPMKVRPLRSQVVLGIEDKLGSQISAQTHHLVTESIRDSIEIQDDASDKENDVSVGFPRPHDVEVHDADDEESTSFIIYNEEDYTKDDFMGDTLTEIEESEEEEDNSQGTKQVLVIGPIIKKDLVSLQSQKEATDLIVEDDQTTLENLENCIVKGKFVTDLVSAVRDANADDTTDNTSSHSEALQFVLRADPQMEKLCDDIITEGIETFCQTLSERQIQPVGEVDLSYVCQTLPTIDENTPSAEDSEEETETKILDVSTSLGKLQTNFEGIRGQSDFVGPNDSDPTSVSAHKISSLIANQHARNEATTCVVPQPGSIRNADMSKSVPMPSLDELEAALSMNQKSSGSNNRPTKDLQIQDDESSGDWSQESACTVQEVDLDNTITGLAAEGVTQQKFLEGVADIAGQLEGIRNQLEDVLGGYVPSSSRSDSSNDYTSSESPSSSCPSNRSSVDVDSFHTASTPTFYSLSQPSNSNYSLLSYYTALSPSSPSPDLSDSPTNTPTLLSYTVNVEDADDTSSAGEEMEESQ